MISVSQEYGNSLTTPSTQLPASKPQIKCHLNSKKNIKNLFKKPSNSMLRKTPTPIVPNPHQITHLITENDITSCLLLSFVIYSSTPTSSTPVKPSKAGQNFCLDFCILFPRSQKNYGVELQQKKDFEQALSYDQFSLIHSLSTHLQPKTYLFFLVWPGSGSCKFPNTRTKFIPIFQRLNLQKSLPYQQQLLKLKMENKNRHKISNKKRKQPKHQPENDKDEDSDFSAFRLSKSSSEERDFSPYQPPSSWKQKKDKVREKQVLNETPSIVKKKLKYQESKKKNQRSQLSESPQSFKDPHFSEKKQSEKKNLKLEEEENSHQLEENPIEQQENKDKKVIMVQQEMKEKQNQQSSQEDQESLIAEHPKQEFKQTIRECMLERSDKKENDEGLMENKGGVCFDLNVKDFIFKEQKKSNNKNKKKKKKNINSSQEVLKRRQQAFIYGQTIRRRMFGPS